MKPRSKEARPQGSARRAMQKCTTMKKYKGVEEEHGWPCILCTTVH